MIKTKRYAKPIYALLALALVLSLGIMAVPMAGTVQAAAWGPYTGPKESAFPRSHGTTTSDPTGDTYGYWAVQHDITSFSACYTATQLIITVEFAGPISAYDSGLPNAVDGYIDFDTDQNPATGMSSNVDFYSPYTSGLGVDYFVSLDYSSATGDTPVSDDTGTEVGRAPVSFTSNSFTVRVPLSLIGGDDGIVDTATVVGTVLEPTDACPNGGYITSSSAGQVTIFSECFEGGLPGDWTVVNNGGDCVWQDDDPDGRGPLDGCSGTFMIADSDWCGPGSFMDTELVTPTIDCSGYSTVMLEFDHYFRYYTDGLNEVADVDVWDGTMWHNKARYEHGDFSGHVTIDISDVAAGKSNVKVRWHYYNASYEWYWEVDCVKLSGSPTYEPIEGVGGEAYPVNKLAILAPWIAFGAAIIAGGTTLLRRRRAQS
jgi:hypothetical protein